MWENGILLIIILFGALLSSVSLLCSKRISQRQVNRLSHLCMLSVFALSLLSPLLLPFKSQLAWKIPVALGLDLDIVLQYDALTWVMLCLVSFVSLIIHSYAARYLLSDSNQPRFMGQLSLLTFSVMFLMSSGSLLTAFIAWQFIGMSLYLLLNHYHYDLKANKAAKKKFMINRVGDLCFLTAVILATLKYGNTDYATLFKHAHEENTALLSLVFIAIMTKSAQFPFHLWLIDTMEAPTPVSALMHGGVINAGGFLLARLSPLYDQAPDLLLFIFIIGLVTALLGNFFMRNQADIKKQLAYSTMGQMGYMIMQCGLGCFGSAVFHLIAHGFYKATSFLGSGNRLNQNNLHYSVQKNPKQKVISGAFCALITAMLLAFGIYYLAHTHDTVSLNPLLWFFIAISLFQLLNSTLVKKTSIKAQAIQVVIITTIFFAYLILLKHFNLFLSTSVAEIEIHSLGWTAVATISATVVCSLVFYAITQPGKRTAFYAKLYSAGLFKLNIEPLYRRLFINPTRKIGDILLTRYNQSSPLTKKIALFTLSSWLTLTLLLYFLTLHSPHFLNYMPLLFINLVLLVVLLLMANRAPQLSQLAMLLAFVMVFTATLAAGLRQNHLPTIGIFQLINSLVVIGGFYVVSRRSNQTSTDTPRHNKLPWSHFYLSVFLVILIGLPGTASFISELYLLTGLLQLNLFYAIIFIITLLLLALAVLHTLQVHFFNPRTIPQYSAPLSKILHAICLSIIGFNLFNGIHPGFLLQLLSTSIKG